MIFSFFDLRVYTWGGNKMDWKRYGLLDYRRLYWSWHGHCVGKWY